MAYGVNGFGGGNVAASMGEDGILLVDDMYAGMVPKLQRALGKVSSLPIRLVVNTHFHGDHIDGNSVLGPTTVIIGHDNVLARLNAGKTPPAYPMVTFTDSIHIRFNGETVHVRHYPAGHTDGDAVVFFENSKVLHMGDMFFFGMFPAVYREGGGDVRGLIASLERVVVDYPADTRVIPGHGALATMTDVRDYLAMLKETVAAADAGIRAGKSAEQLQADPAFVKYAALGDGGAQTLPQYVAMLMKLLK
jgi:glyoxylase-like metal-dependent hydrolase (beta-lactamase superfamily II)